VSFLYVRPFHTQRETDPLPHRICRLRHGVRIVQLWGIAHDEQPAWLEVDVYGGGGAFGRIDIRRAAPSDTSPI
jgi:hypothetical protein